MKPDDMLFGRRIRQNHALEHATITILSGYVPDLRVSARSSSRGFIIFGDVDLGQLRRSLDEALQRLQAGEAELAIHPNCGTNLVVGGSPAGAVCAKARYDTPRFTGGACQQNLPPQNSWYDHRRSTNRSGVVVYE